MTRQLDMMPTELVSESVLERIDAKLPKQREVKAPRLPSVLPVVDATVDELLNVKHHEVDAQ